jgi:ornithine cyclodeaminase
MRVIGAAEVHALLDYPATVEALRELYRRGVDLVDSLVVSQPSSAGGRDDLLLLPAWQRGRWLGVKIVNVFPGNAGSALPTIVGSYILIDGRDGQHLALIDGTALTLRKTAANSALGACYLAREDAATMTMVGAGALAPHVVAAHCAVRPSIGRVWVWNRTPERADRLAATLRLPGVTVAATRDLEAAVRGSDVIACATAATAPLVRGAWLRPGAHLDLIGGYTRTMRESDDACVRVARVFVDGRRRVPEECGDVCQPIASGALDPAAIVADLFELARGEKWGRESASEITFFKNGGGGHQDLGCAELLWRRVAVAG